MLTISEIEYDTLVQRLSERDALIATLRKRINMLENDTVCSLQASVESLTEDNRRLSQANRRLNAANNNIRTVPDKEKNVLVGWARAIAWNIRVLNRFECAKKPGIPIPSYGRPVHAECA